jgi:hypothetical protein
MLGVMTFATPAGAVRAAVSAAADFEIRCTDPVILADGANVIVHLRPSAVVAKVAASAAPPDETALGSMLRELHVVLRSYPSAAGRLGPGPSVASRYMDGSRVLAAYGDAVDARELDICRRLRQLDAAAGRGMGLPAHPP